MSSFYPKNKLSSQPKIALVHDDFVQVGGAESLFATIASIWPNAPIYTSVVDWNKLPATMNKDRVRLSFMQKIPFATKFYKLLLPIYPLVFESFNFDDFDLVISSTTRFAKSVITKPKTIHICYLNSVPRFLWQEEIQKDYLLPILGIFLKPILKWLRRWDKVAASRVDHYIANSQNVKNAIQKNYGLEAQVIYPFADLNFFKPAKIHSWKLKSQNYFLIVSRLVKWKKIDYAIEAANDLKINLKIVGNGPDEIRLKKIVIRNQESETGNQIEFLGKVTKEELRSLYQNCRALIVSQQEDFGISAVEAQACGRPVITYDRGGVREIIQPIKTGLLFKTQTKEALADAIQMLSRLKWSVQACRKNSLRFSRANFIRGLKNKVENYASKS